MDDIRTKKRVRDFLPTRRRLIQLYAALLHNANLKGYIQGEIYTGRAKTLCVPGLNCYSCPGRRARALWARCRMPWPPPAIGPPITCWASCCCWA